VPRERGEEPTGRFTVETHVEKEDSIWTLESEEEGNAENRGERGWHRDHGRGCYVHWKSRRIRPPRKKERKKRVLSVEDEEGGQPTT